MSAAEMAEYEEKKLKMRKAMGENLHDDVQGAVPHVAFLFFPPSTLLFSFLFVSLMRSRSLSFKPCIPSVLDKNKHSVFFGFSYQHFVTTGETRFYRSSTPAVCLCVVS